MKYFIFIIMIIRSSINKAAHISTAGNFDPFGTDESSLNHSIPQLSETNSNETAGPSLDLIDSHRHSHDGDDNSSIIESARRSLIQPSIDFLDAELHGGDEHVHQAKDPIDRQAADLYDFKQWLEEQNQTNQLTRFLLLQKEINRLPSDATKDLREKLNRTIEELKSVKYDL